VALRSKASRENTISDSFWGDAIADPAFTGRV
jgi:hypothetical protein